MNRGATSSRQRHRVDATVLETRRVRLVSFSVRTQDGWGTGRAQCDDDEPFAITGKVLDARPGDSLELRGSRFMHPKYGEQFKIESCVPMRPDSVDGVVAWLAATIPTVGEARARDLLSHFGTPDALWAAIETNPESLAAVRGITTEAAARIQTVYLRERDSRDHMIALRAWGLTTNQIQKCLDEWESLDVVVSEVRENPYALARHVDGFGFKRADEVARAQGMAHNDPRRVAAGIAHVLEQATFDGHCFMWGGQLQRVAAGEVLSITNAEAAEGIRRALREATIVRHGARYYTAAMGAHEASAATALDELTNDREGQPTP
jgi:exodeoxyribonuclease V alpha subunit